MRKFSSYGPIDPDLHYHAPRQALIDQACWQLIGENPAKGGHYITVWAPRQRGKSWIMQQVLFSLRTDISQNPISKIKNQNGFTTAVLPMEYLKTVNDVNEVIESIATKLKAELALENVEVNTLQEFDRLFLKDVLKKPLILILDEFDALPEGAISGLVGIFRNIYMSRQYQADKPTAEKDYLLHSVALIGVRAVLGIENVKGSPFNVQHSLHIPNLTFEEVTGMFQWYEQESGQTFEPEVISQLFDETQGQPGLTCWFGELLTETYNKHQPTISKRDFEIVYAAATSVLPNNNILNIISKAKQEPHKQFILEMFKTDKKIAFTYDDQVMNFLYLNGVIDHEVVDETRYYLKFPCPFVQKRLFNYFARELVRDVGKLYEPFEDLEDTVTDDNLNIKNLLRRYQGYLQKNRHWLLRDAPRRTTDLRIYEAVYHFSLYRYLAQFLESYGGQVYPEFPTGNGQIDLILKYSGQRYGLELKSYTHQKQYKDSLKQAARYGKQLKLAEISLVFFVEGIDETQRQKYEVPYLDDGTGVTVMPIFVEIGN